ncbi:PH domain-containing protein [Streptomyces sp. NPDC059452]|uniref:PH domain-containing protein n=1 Tax=Streptomyces sp. NPDC059452 TaxID=3346835 RepID=UPI00368E25B4
MITALRPIPFPGKSPVVVLRRKSGPIIGIVALVLGGSVSAWVLVAHADRSSVPDRVTVAMLVLFCMRVGWRAVGRPRVEAHPEGLLVVGLMGRSWINAREIRLISTENGMTVVLADGYEVPVFAFSASMLDRGRTEQAASQLRGVLRKGAVVRDPVPSTRSPDFTWFDLAFVPLPVLMLLSAAGIWGTWS